MTPPTPIARVAHVLRRTGFGLHPGSTELVAATVDGPLGAVEAVLAAPPLPPGPAPSFARDGDGPRLAWLRRMAEPGAGLHERMVWWWHGYLTTSQDKVDDWRLVYDQHLLLRRHAFGSFRHLLAQMVVDPAMLLYLDGDGSSADAPNENLGRELMELFTVGRGHYDQRDVRAAAVALSGWSVDAGRAVATFDPSSGPTVPVGLLGRAVASAGDVVDVLCDQPACPLRLATALHTSFVGTPPQPGRASELANVWVDSGSSSRALLEAVLRSPEFVDAAPRPRTALEWVVAAAIALGTGSDAAAMLDACWRLGQVPYDPPNVAGWPGGVRWLSPSASATHAAIALQWAATPGTPGLRAVAGAADPVDAALRRCGLFDVSVETDDALRGAAAAMAADPSVDSIGAATTLLALTLTSPEFCVA